MTDMSKDEMMELRGWNERPVYGHPNIIKMTDNEKLARWQGWEEYHSDINKHVPDYLNDDAAAMSLLDTLVDKGYDITLEYAYKSCTFQLWKNGYAAVPLRKANTISKAVCAAVLELIEKGDV